jgi:hypothetical protein
MKSKRPAPKTSHVDPRKPAGNAQYDPAEQTRRTDMPEEEQKSTGEPARGTAPSQSADRSNQPHPAKRKRE